MENREKNKKILKYTGILFGILIVLSVVINSMKEKEQEDKLNKMIEDASGKEIDYDTEIKNQFMQRFSVFPQAVFNTKSNYELNVTNKILTLKFEVSEHYDYSSDEKLKLRMVIEGIKLFDKIDYVSGVNFITSYQGKEYKVKFDESEYSMYSKDIGRTMKNSDILEIWNKCNY